MKKELNHLDSQTLRYKQDHYTKYIVDDTREKTVNKYVILDNNSRILKL